MKVWRTNPASTCQRAGTGARKPWFAKRAKVTADAVEGRPAAVAHRSIAAPAPGGFGPIGPDWEPRQRHAGTYDERWKRERAPVLPADFDPRHNCVAPPGLWSATPLLGK